MDFEPLNLCRYYKDLPWQNTAIRTWWELTPQDVREKILRLYRNGETPPPPQAMKINQKGLDLIKHFEGLRLNAYTDPVGVWTIGYGHTATAKAGMVITAAEAEDLLKRDLIGFEACVRRVVAAPVNSNQFSALVSLAFNVGCGAFGGSSLAKMVNARQYALAAEQFRRWVYAGGNVLPGLERRRQAERELFLSD